jgi:hypothetical protein
MQSTRLASAQNHLLKYSRFCEDVVVQEFAANIRDLGQAK